MIRYIRILSLLLAIGVGPVARAQLYQLETENLRLIYSRGPHHFIAPYTVQCFENALAFHRELFDYRPSEKVTVVLHDQGDFANAGATATPRNTLIIALAPFSYVYESTMANERMNLLMSHELVHIVAVDRSTGRDRFFRTIFGGKVRETSDNPLSMLYGYLTTPRRDAPRWYHEGIAVFLETWMAGGIGRAQGAFDEMVFRAKVRDSARFYDPVGLESEGTKIDFIGGVNSYLYGTRFMNYLAFEYGPERLIEWVKRSQGSRSYFAAQFHRVYGVSLDRAWGDWVAFEHEFQWTNLDSVRQYALTEYRDLTHRGLGSVSRTFYDSTTSRLYAAVNRPGDIAHIARLDLNTGETERICEIKGPAVYYVTSLAYDPGARTLFFTTDNYQWRDLMAVDPETGKMRTLIKDVRVGDLAFNRADSSLWGVRHYNGLSTLVRIAYPWDDWKQIHSWPYGRDMYDLDISPDGKLMSASLSSIGGRQVLALFDMDSLMQYNPSYRELYEFGYSIPENFVFTADSRQLYGSSYYTGASNIFRYDIALDSLDAMTNAETGFFRPLPVWEDSIIALRFTGDGFLPAVVPSKPLEDVSATTFLGTQVAEKYPVVQGWQLGPPSDVKLDSVVTDSGTYSALRHIGLASIYPVVEGYRTYLAWGLRAELTDPILTHRSDITVSYTGNTSLAQRERWHVNWNWQHRNWTLSLAHNGTNFYDLFGPTRRSRKGNALSLAYDKILIADAPKSLSYNVSIAGYNHLDELPFFQDIPTSFDKFATLGFDIKYGNKRAAMGAVDYQKGIGWQFISYNQFVKDRTYAQVVNNLDFGVPLPISLSSLWLRTSAGYSSGERLDPQANFFFGGFRNNYVDHRTEKRYRKFYTFPGIEINSTGGTNYARGLLEWNLPPWRFSHVGRGWLHWERIRMALFGSALVTNLDDETYRRSLANVGAQLDFRFMLLWHYRMTFSIGYASAFEKDALRTDEWMFSLKIL